MINDKHMAFLSDNSKRNQINFPPKPQRDSSSKPDHHSYLPARCFVFKGRIHNKDSSRS